LITAREELKALPIQSTEPDTNACAMLSGLKVGSVSIDMNYTTTPEGVP
jgi:hypothetical protein